MASAVVDWTVDQLLSGVKTLNARAESQQNTLRANRATYMDTLRSLPSIADIHSREALRSKLSVWIRSQVGLENRFAEFMRNFVAAKAKAKQFLTSAGITPPGYLGAIQIAAVPAAVWGAIAIGLAAIATIAALNSNQTASINGLKSLVERAQREQWNAQDTAEALRAYEGATRAAPGADPLGLANTLKAALPVLVIGGLLYLLGPMLQRKLGRA
jgi:hypothetical protein